MTRNKKITIAGGIILLIGISIGVYQCLFSAPQKGLGMERIVINLGTAEEELIPKLKEQGYIRSEWAFNYVLKKKGWQGKIEPGGYKISKTMNAWYLAETLVNYRYQNWIVIPEGLRKEEIAKILQEGLYWSDNTREEFLNYAKEGYLFPDTYLLEVLNIRDAGKKVAKRMENVFNEKCQAIFKEFEEANIRNDTAIILASIIQREAANEEEMPLIAGIIWNRFLKDMKFEIDATVQYVLGEPGNWWPIIKPEDYKVDSPYNTYLHKGRPPAPICNPGLAAIEAVIYSEESDYLYYLHDEEGKIHPALTYKEHLRNIEKYLTLPVIKIAAFNIEIFGKATREKENVMNVLKKIAQEFDIMLVQEIRDIKQETAPYYLQKINEAVGYEKYAFKRSERLGRSKVKEVYVYFYNTDKVEFIENSDYVYNDVNDVFEREPYIASFKSGSFDFTLVGIHIKPDDADSEIGHLANIVDLILAENPNEKDIIVMGDFNADGTYFDEDNDTNPFKASRFHWVITNEMDTMVETDWTYDRMVMMDDTLNYEYIENSVEVFYFDEEYGIDDRELIEDISDHYPIYADFKTDLSDDD